MQFGDGSRIARIARIAIIACHSEPSEESLVSRSFDKAKDDRKTVGGVFDLPF